VTLFDELLEANARFAKNFPGTELTAVPSRQITILTCMDARIDNFTAFGLEVGDAHILRNAGGRVTDDVIRSLVLSNDILGTRYVAVIHHTECGLVGTSNEAIRDAIAVARRVDLSAIDFDPFEDVDQSVRDDLARLAAAPLLRDDISYAGFAYDVANGVMRVVPPPTPPSTQTTSAPGARGFRNDAYIEEFRANAGQLGGSFSGVPVLLLHATDVALGETRVTPLTCQPLESGWAIFASKGGSTAEPGWYGDLLVDPVVTIEFGADTIEARARVAMGAERDEIWTRQKELMPAFAGYAQVANRTIPVLVIEPR
jgi:carbonic anhydrase